MNEDFKKVLKGIFDVLREKNRRYGNAALAPSHIFYKGDSVSSIAIRLDDKISRVKNSKTLRKNDMFDILGYLILYSISCGYFGCKKNGELDDNLKIIEEECVSKSYNLHNTSIFTKDQSSINIIEKNITIIQYDSPNVYILSNLICAFVFYFVENNITDFSDLID